MNAELERCICDIVVGAKVVKRGIPIYYPMDGEEYCREMETIFTTISNDALSEVNEDMHWAYFCITKCGLFATHVAGKNYVVIAYFPEYWKEDRAY